MYIKKITLKNFKSFGKRVEVPFFKGFTVISGPNGSGKSNIIDSIVFCLGLSTSTKALRAEKLTDLIHTGKNEAEVSITFDNSDSSLPFSGDVTVTRRIRVTERGYYSYYYVNGKQCSLSDIQDMLSRAGIHGDAYNVIMQGDVTRLAEMTPVQRRRIIDDIAGISEFEEKREKAIEELDRVRENIEKIEAVLSEVTKRLEELERDREEAIRYKSLLEEKDYTNRVIETHHYNLLLGKKEKLEREIEKLELDKDRIVSRMAELKVKLSEINSKIKEISSKIAEITGTSYDEISQRMLEINSEIEAIRKSESIYREEIKRNREKLTEINLSISNLEEELEKLLTERERTSIERESVKAVLEEIEAKIEIYRTRLEEVDLESKNLKDELLKEKDELERLKSERSDALRERDRLVDSARMLEVNVEELRRKRDSIKKRIEELERGIDEKLREMNRAEMRASKLVKRRNEVDSELFSLRNELAEVEEKIKSIEVELAKLRAEMNAIESGFSKGVDLVLEARERRALPGIFGTVAQLCEVDEQFALALEVAAGNALQYIVVENEDDAVRAINYLKQIRGGRATFLPLTRMKKNFGKLELDESVLKYPGVIDYAVNLVRCERKFKPVFNYVFRDTLVVDKIETAKVLMDKFGGRMVTLDGDLVERSGAMSGGYIEKRRGFLLSRDMVEKEKKLMEEATVLKSRKIEVMSRIKKAEEDRREIQKLVDEVSSEVRRLRDEIDHAKREVVDCGESVKRLDEKIFELEANRKSLFSQIAEVERKVEALSKEIAEKEKRIEEIERRLKGSEVPELSRKYDELKEERSEIYRRLLNAESRLESVEMKVKQAEERIEEKRREAERARREIEELERRIEEGRNRIRELEEEMRELKREEERIGRQVRELRKERDELVEKAGKLERDVDSCKYAIMAIEERIRARNDALLNVKMEIEKVDTSRLLSGSIPPMEEAVKRLEEIEKELRSFGEVNMKAIQEYEEVKARREDLLEKKLSLERERSEILERIERYEKMKREAFFEAFNAIRANFSKVMKLLTDGEGELYLDGEDPFNSGLNIRVKPYGKPVQRIESLSGGEKSLIALALIFAIQMYRPAPFYAFDEIDMFLDGANVSRVAKLIKERSKDAQFIVVSLRKPTLEMADAIVGVTMDRNNCSKVTGIKLRAEKRAVSAVAEQG